MMVFYVESNRILRRFPFYIIVALFLISSSQPGFATITSSIQSIKLDLRLTKSDSAKVRLLNFLSEELSKSNPDTALVVSKQAVQLSSKLVSSSDSKELPKILLLQAGSYKALATVYKVLGKHSEADATYKKVISIGEKLNDKKLKGTIYAQLADNYDLSGNDTLAEQYFKKALATLNSIHDSIGLIDVHNNLGVFYEGRSKYKMALENLKLSIFLAIRFNRKEELADSYNNVANTFGDQGNYPRALDYYLKSMRIMEEIGDKHGMSNAYYNLGNMYHSLENFPLALDYLKRSLKIDKELNDLKSIATCYSGLGLTYASMDSVDIAMMYHMKSLKIREDLHDRAGLAVVYSNLGDLYEEKQKYGIALTYYEMALAIDIALNKKKDIAIDYQSIGSVYKEKGNYKMALNFLNQAFSLGVETRSKETLAKICEDLSITHERMGNNAEALQYFKFFKSYQDSVLNANNFEEIANMRAQYDFENQARVQESINLAKEERQLAELSKQKTINYSLGGGGVLVLLLSLITLKGYNQKKKANIVISGQKQVVEEKQKEIMDSITYAKRLQDAILPPMHLVKEQFPESFILFQPKDIVAGDFYWFESIIDKHTGEELNLFAVADCTGHGVPGAMVSIVCSNALNRAVKEFQITEPAEILNKVRALVVETFSKSESEVKDGMDISLFSLNKSTGTLKWAGANNPLYIIRTNNNSSPSSPELLEIKADKQPIGKSEYAKPFTTHTIQLNNGDCIYIFTDGYADQFGGEKGKKFRTRNFKNLLLSIQKEQMPVQHTLIEEAFHNWKGELMQVDDVCVMGIRYQKEI